MHACRSTLEDPTDFIPFADEILLGLSALVLSAWQKSKEVASPPATEARPPIEHEPPPRP